MMTDMRSLAERKIKEQERLWNRVGASLLTRVGGGVLMVHIKRSFLFSAVCFFFYSRQAMGTISSAKVAKDRVVPSTVQFHSLREWQQQQQQRSRGQI